MSTVVPNIHTRQIKTHITETLKAKIDLSDAKDHDRESKMLSRGITVLAAMRVAEIEEDEAISSITDGPDDNGIDAIVVNALGNGRIFLFQAKWSDSGTKTIEVGDTHKFIQGCRDLLACKWSRFNAKIQARSKEIENVLNQVNTQVVLVLVFPSTNPIPHESQILFNAFMSENNDGGELVSLKTVQLAQLKASALSQIAGEIALCEATFFEWGKVHKPYEAVYGQVACSDVSSWYEANGVKLFAQNIRSFVGDTDVNLGIMRTLMDEPEAFWYMNNGITAICDAIRKKPIGGHTNDSSVYVFDNLRVVNGAQTVGSIAEVAKRAADRVARARVLVRVVSKQESPISFEDQLTTKTNTQNRIDARDFIALDPTQIRLKTELLARGIDYVFRAGEKANQPNSFDVQEAAIALACSQRDVTTAVYAKRNIGELLNRSSKQYATLFTDAVSGDVLWQAVLKLRAVEYELGKVAKTTSGRDHQLVVHGNRVFAQTAMTESSFWTDGEANAPKVSQLLIQLLLKSAETYIATYHADAYLAVLFKNAEKCEFLAAALRTSIRESVARG